MKKFTLLMGAWVLVAFSISSAHAASAATQKRYESVQKSSMQVDECKSKLSLFSSPTFGDKTNPMSVKADATLGTIMIGNNDKAFKLTLNLGIIQVLENDKWQTITYSIDQKGFLSAMKNMYGFVNQALEVAHDKGSSFQVKQVTCASKMLEFAEKEHLVKS